MQQQKQKQQNEDSQENKLVQNQSPIQVVLQKLGEQKQNLIQAIRTIQNQEVQLQVNQSLTEQIKDKNKSEIRGIVKQIVIIEKKIQLLTHKQQQKPADINKQNDNQPQIKNDTYTNKSTQQIQQQVNKQTNELQISEQAINTRYNQLTSSLNDSNWTDATESQADDDQIWAVDDEIMKAMEEDSEEEMQQKQQQQQQQETQNVNLQQLQNQFVIGQQSDHHLLFGKHDKFCVSVNGIEKQNLLFSGGGDDYLYMYKIPNQQFNKQKCINPFHLVKHTQTVSKIEVSFSKQYVFTMTDNQILCTDIQKLQTTKLKTRKNEENMKKQKKQQESEQESEPICSDMVCHHQGDVVAISSGYQLQIYNIKGLKLYQTYYCERIIQMFQFDESGKQIIMACDDNKIRLLTPKTSQFATISGLKQHQSQISVIKNKDDIVLSGCIDGYIGVTSLKKKTMTTLIGSKQTEDLEGSINVLEFAGNYFMAGSVSDNIDWYDLSKTKKLFKSPIQGSASDICWQGQIYPSLYTIGTLKGFIHLYDCRNPLKQTSKVKAGNTVHKIWAQKHNFVAACEDGCLRFYDIRKII